MISATGLQRPVYYKESMTSTNEAHFKDAVGQTFQSPLQHHSSLREVVARPANWRYDPTTICSTSMTSPSGEKIDAYWSRDEFRIYGLSDTNCEAPLWSSPSSPPSLYHLETTTRTPEGCCCVPSSASRPENPAQSVIVYPVTSGAVYNASYAPISGDYCEEDLTYSLGWNATGGWAQSSAGISLMDAVPQPTTKVIPPGRLAFTEFGTDGRLEGVYGDEEAEEGEEEEEEKGGEAVEERTKMERERHSQRRRRRRRQLTSKLVRLSWKTRFCSGRDALMRHCRPYQRRHSSTHRHHANQRQAANMRERRRMQSINHAFEAAVPVHLLSTHLVIAPATLRPPSTIYCEFARSLSDLNHIHLSIRKSALSQDAF
ncbi:unnamed protein product [Schistocephalus solidus]|uniref:BHLH domain-containing protein n=1 Tax=Schistocephalus solidus TaxID=70667 RepID=A0A183T804_SCHSO|nr:unnamed protein product [Schistocephalus solidus]